MKPTAARSPGDLLPIDSSLRRQMIDGIALAWAFFTSCAYALVLVRALEIGWHVRDFIQLAFVASGVLVAVLRRRLSTKLKFRFLVGVSVAAGVTGYVTFGILAGSAYFFLVATTLVAIYCRRRVVVGFALFILLIMAVIGTGFATGRLRMASDASLLATSSIHWVLVVFCVALYLLIACGAVLTYRRAMETMLVEAERRNVELSETNEALMEARSEVRTLRGILPTCMHCKNIRPPGQEQGDPTPWVSVETYVREHSEAEFSHGICPECMKASYPEYSRD
jgi:hypothetical protein